MTTPGTAAGSASTGSAVGTATHDIFYYPYASFTQKQAPLLKAAALYFDKLFVLDPEQASAGTIGAVPAASDLKLLADAKILERIPPAEVLHAYEQPITDAIRADVSDREFEALCAQHGTRTAWSLALAKVPKDLRQDARFAPLDQSMQRLLGKTSREVAPTVGMYMELYQEIESRPTKVYSETQPTSHGVLEYRYIDLPLPAGEAVMLNHALFAGLLLTDATPLTDDEFHHKVFEHKIARARADARIGKQIEERMQQRRLRHDQLARTVLTDVELGLLPDNVPLEKILRFRLDHGDELRQAREFLGVFARRVKEEPWSPEFAEHVDHDIMPGIQQAVISAKQSWGAWLKAVGLGATTAGAVISLMVAPTPLAPVTILLGALPLVTGVAIPGLQLFRERKGTAYENGLHYMLKFRR
jgi:hypothetical protein